MFSERPEETIMLWPGPRYCPKCTEVIRFQFDSTYAGCSYNPVYLIKRTNKKTKDWFWGCPNFPKCKHYESRAKTQEEKDIKIRAWANAQGGSY